MVPLLAVLEGIVLGIRCRRHLLRGIFRDRGRRAMDGRRRLCLQQMFGGGGRLVAG